jgi:hypothetical protein
MDGVDVERRTTGTSVRMWKKRVDQPSPSTSMRT